MNTRPRKKILDPQKVKGLRNKAIAKIRSEFLPDEKIVKIYLIGSSVKGNFGHYEQPGFRGSLYSDFDFIIFVEDDYRIPELEREPTACPFPDDVYNLAYRVKEFVDDAYDAEIFFVRRSTMENKDVHARAEAAGCEIPFFESSQWPHIQVFPV